MSALNDLFEENACSYEESSFECGGGDGGDGGCDAGAGCDGAGSGGPDDGLGGAGAPNNDGTVDGMTPGGGNWDGEITANPNDAIGAPGGPGGLNNGQDHMGIDIDDLPSMGGPSSPTQWT